MIIITEEDRKLAQKIGLRIKHRLEMLDMNQAKLAKLSGVDKAQISLLVRGRCVPLVSTALKIAKALDMSIEELIK